MKATTATLREAYSDGHLAALDRKSEAHNPYKKGTNLAKAWLQAHRKIMETRKLHTTPLQRRPSSFWLNQLE